MSLQSALDYIRQIRSDDSLRSEILHKGHIIDLPAHAREGRKRGLAFSTAELARAHTIDWKLRAHRYGTPDPSSSPSNSAHT